VGTVVVQGCFDIKGVVDPDDHGFTQTSAERRARNDAIEAEARCFDAGNPFMDTLLIRHLITTERLAVPVGVVRWVGGIKFRGDAVPNFFGAELGFGGTRGAAEGGIAQTGWHWQRLHERGEGWFGQLGDVTGLGLRASEFQVESPSGERGPDRAFLEEAAAAGISGFGFRGHRVCSSCLVRVCVVRFLKFEIEEAKEMRRCVL